MTAPDVEHDDPPEPDQDEPDLACGICNSPVCICSEVYDSWKDRFI
ncbi:MAG: hypothetical protein ACXVYY_01170 [Oryzihumus sp.]